MTEGSIGARLKQARAAQAPKMSQESLARLVDVSTMTVSRYERDDMTPTEQNLSRICEVLGIRAAWLRYGDGPMSVDDAPTPAPESRVELDEDEAAGTAEQALRFVARARDVDEGTVAALRERLEAVQFSDGGRLSTIVSFLEDELVALQAARRPRYEEEGEAGAPKPVDDGVMRRTPRKRGGR